MHNHQNELSQKNYLHLPNFANELSTSLEDQRDFQKYWNDLAPDRNFESYTTRERRILRFTFTHPDQLVLNPDAEYVPKAQYNVAYKKGANTLTYVNESFITHPLMERILAADLTLIDNVLQVDQTYTIDIHLFRVRADSGDISPTTSGVHQDGHEWIFMHFINRHNTQPVLSRIHSENAHDPVILETVMTQFLENHSGE